MFITLEKEKFISKGGLFVPAFEGRITDLIDFWTQSEAAQYEFL